MYLQHLANPCGIFVFPWNSICSFIISCTNPPTLPWLASRLPPLGLCQCLGSIGSVEWCLRIAFLCYFAGFPAFSPICLHWGFPISWLLSSKTVHLSSKTASSIHLLDWIWSDWISSGFSSSLRSFIWFILRNHQLFVYILGWSLRPRMRFSLMFSFTKNDASKRLRFWELCSIGFSSQDVTLINLNFLD
jgi:hypothetical protein